MGLANVAGRTGQARLDPPVQGGGHERLTALLLGGVNDQTTVGREARAFVRCGVGQRCDGATGKIHQLQLERSTRARDVRHPTAIRADGRGDVVTPIESDPIGSTPIGGHAVDLGRAAPVADEVDRLAVWRVRGLGVDTAALAQPLRRAARRVKRVDLGIASQRERRQQLAPVWRPGRSAVGALEIGQQPPSARRHLMRIDHRLAGFKGNVGQLATVGRPCR